MTDFSTRAQSELRGEPHSWSSRAHKKRRDALQWREVEPIKRKLAHECTRFWVKQVETEVKYMALCNVQSLIGAIGKERMWNVCEKHIDVSIFHIDGTSIKWFPHGLLSARGPLRSFWRMHVDLAWMFPINLYNKSVKINIMKLYDETLSVWDRRQRPVTCHFLPVDWTFMK